MTSYDRAKGEEPCIVARVHKSMVVKLSKDTYLVKLGTAEDVIRLVSAATEWPGKAVMMRREKK